MLVSQAEAVREQLKTLKKLEEDEKNRQDIEATFDELIQLTKDIRSLVTTYQLIRNRLTLEQIAYITSQVRLISSDLETSHQAFDQQRRQVRQLQSVTQQSNTLNQQIEAAWKSYAETQITPLVELLKLVRRFPEVKGQLSELDAQKQYLEQFTYRLPSSQQNLTEFDRKLQQLSTQLSNLKLDPAIKDFLNCVFNGEATLADLSDEVLEWCRQGNRAKTFKITFR